MDFKSCLTPTLNRKKPTDIALKSSSGFKHDNLENAIKFCADYNTVTVLRVKVMTEKWSGAMQEQNLLCTVKNKRNEDIFERDKKLKTFSTIFTKKKHSERRINRIVNSLNFK